MKLFCVLMMDHIRIKQHLTIQHYKKIDYTHHIERMNNRGIN